ncbi:MAG: transglutaminase domain-containing protein [Candidatus Shapirobacteria bacterium]|jgi:transglutaminase-like putative cysteine protease
MFFVIGLLFLFFLSSPCQATDFSLSESINFTLNVNGDAFASHTLSQTNLSQNSYINEYQVQLPYTNLKNISAHDFYGQILKTIDIGSSQTSLALKLNRPPLGVGKSQAFSFSYFIPGFGQKKGNTWELILPTISRPDNNPVNLQLLIPLTYGKLAFSSIQTSNLTITGSSQIINISNFQSYDKPLLFVFGDYQLFDFLLHYYLENNRNHSIQTEIAIPPQTEDQQIILRSISPPPINIYADPDGNWLATYTLEPGENFKVEVNGQAKIFPKLFKTTVDSPQNYLTEQPFWPVSQPQIQELSRAYRQPREIYNFVVETLSYNYAQASQPKRKGALEALADPANSLCTEFTDLFISIARAANIPSRELEGYAFTNNLKIKPINENGDILHAWPQYYDKYSQSWKSIDPTWGKTTNGIDYFTDLDLNHLVFVIHGSSSDYPVVPGSYKEKAETKTVFVETAKQSLSPTYQTLLVTSTKPTRLFGIPRITLHNPNPNVIENIILNSTSNNWTFTIDQLPPFSTREIAINKINFFDSLLPHNQKITISQQFNNLQSNYYQKIIYYPHYQNLIISVIGLIILLALIGMSVTSNKDFRHAKTT